jgi:MFS transporter, FHS family, glucose/mannose:H+ symporter
MIDRRPLTAAACAGMLVFGVVMALLGAVLPSLTARLRFDLREAGLLFLAMNGAMLVSSFVLGPAMDRFGMKPPMVAGPLLVGAALELMDRAESVPALVVSVVCLGFGGGALNSATNTLVADLHGDPKEKSAALNLLGVFFGVGAVLLPFGLGAVVEQLGLGFILKSAALLCVCIAASAAIPKYPPAKQGHQWPVSEIPRFLRTPLVLAMAMLLFCESGNEFLLGGYLSTYLTREQGATIASASWMLALFWASIMAARIVLSRVLLRADGPRVVLVSAAGAVSGCVALAAAPNTAVAALGLVVVGLSLASIFPTVLGVAGSHFAEHSGTVFGILFTLALAGGMTLPWLAGQMAEPLGVRSAFWLAGASFAAIFGITATRLR